MVFLSAAAVIILIPVTAILLTADHRMTQSEPTGLVVGYPLFIERAM
jgi:hypothetical protein